MGKKRIVKKNSSGVDSALKARSLAKVIKKKIVEGVLYVESSYNNTRLSLSDKSGNILAWSSSGSLGFKGAKKGTPFAASKIGELIGEKAQQVGIKEVAVVVKGVGSGRESAIRGFSTFGVDVVSIIDKTPVPHNGPKPRKPRHV
ncbi:30S ribosomal protein S11 [Candidatus Gracilibacteria bacterium]|nr:30S ribosomal protein S11 [Candidatus Gracilibacteria bacterium]MCF7898406.1 30S ribosomal protein S11 [Candidatus Paceibacterota bacterium]